MTRPTRAAGRPLSAALLAFAASQGQAAGLHVMISGGFSAAYPEAARDLIRFLASREAQPAIIKSGMEPVGATMTKGPRGGEMQHPPRGVEMTREPVPAAR